MTRYKPAIIFLVSLAIIDVTKCDISRAMEALQSAGKVNFNITIHYVPSDPITESNVVNELKEYFESGLNSDEKLHDDLKHFLHTALVHSNMTEKQTKSSLHNFYKSLNKIDEFYHSFDQLLTVKSAPNMTEIEKYFDRVLSEKTGVNSSLDNILQLSINDLNLFHILARYYDETDLCNGTPVLRQHHIMHFFNVLLNKVYKGNFLIMTAHKFMMRRKKENHLYRVKKALAVARYQLKKYAESVKVGLTSASREIRLCDGHVNVKNQTYVEIVGPSQGFIFDSSAVSERVECKLLNDEQDRCEKNNPSCFGHTCSSSGGSLKNCETISGKTLTICPAVDVSKKYLSAESESNTYGNQSAVKNCPVSKLKRTVTAVRMYPGAGSSDVFSEPNSFCYCSCVRKRWLPGDVRVISLQWVTSNYMKNKVITGLRFVEKHGMISLQAQQGLILPGGLVDNKTVAWNDLPLPENYQYSNGTLHYSYPPARKGQKPRILTPSEDFVYITSELSMNLDNIVLSDNHVVVGVRLCKAEQPGGRDPNQLVLELAIMTARYDDLTGLLDYDSVTNLTASQFMGVKMFQAERDVLSFGVVGNPTMAEKENDQFSGYYKQIKFRQTHIRKDLGQSIVPFFDTRRVTTTPALPLASVGLYHRTTLGSGGFLGFEFEAYDMKRNFDKIVEMNLNDLRS